MGALLVGIVLAIVGALITLAGTYYARLRDQFEARGSALDVVEQDLKTARQEIERALGVRSLWPSYRRLAPSMSPELRRALRQSLSRSTWMQVDTLISGLETLDARASELRARGPGFDDEFAAELQTTAEGIGTPEDKYGDTALAKLENAAVGATWLPDAARFVVAIGGVVLVAGVLVIVLQGATWTGSSVGTALKGNLRGAQSEICDASTTLEGAYTCSVTFPPCALGQVRIDKQSTCSPSLEVTYDVETQGRCYVATRTADTITGDPPPTLLDRLRTFFVRRGCKRG